MTRSLPLVTLVALGAAAYAPLPSMAQTDVQLYIGTAPPAPLYERMPGARRGHVWVPGYWAWNGRRHHWMPGTYIVERPGYVYSRPAWQQRGGRWTMQQGGWAPQRGERHHAYRDGDRQYASRDGYRREVYYDRDGRPQEYRGRDRDRDGIPDRIERRGGDSDRDGIPNSRDNDRDNDGVANKYDRDRDGDGRPNRRDSAPDNPYSR